MEIFPHSTLVAQVSDPYTPETPPPRFYCFHCLPLSSSYFWFFSLVWYFLIPYEVMPCITVIAIRGHWKWPNLSHTHKPKTKMNKSGSNRRSNRVRYHIMVKKVPFSPRGHLLKIFKKRSWHVDFHVVYVV